MKGRNRISTDDAECGVKPTVTLNLIGSGEKLAQWPQRSTGPAYYSLGRNIIYRGTDLNAWAEAHRVDTAA